MPIQLMIIRIITLFFLLFISIFGTIGQEDKQALFRAIQDNTFDQIFTNTSIAKKRIDSLISIENQMEDTTRAMNYNLLGIYLNVTGNMDSSIVVFKKGLEINGDYAYRRKKFLKNIGTALRNAGDYNQSLAIFQELNDTYRSENDTLDYANTLGELASIYNLTLQHEKAVENLTTAIDLFEQQKGDDSNLGVLLQRLANTYLKQEKYDFAIEIYDQALEKFKAANRMDNYYLTLINVADCYQYKEEYEKGLPIIEESIDGLKQFDNSRLLAVAYGVQGDLLKNLNKIDASILSYEKAISHAFKISSNRTIQIAREYLKLLIRIENYQRAAELINDIQPYMADANIEYQYSYLEVEALYYESTGEFEKALDLLKEAHALKDSSYYENKQQLVDDIQALYRVNEKEKQNRNLNKTIVQKDQDISYLTLGVILLLILCLFIIVIWVTRSNYQKRIIALEKKERSDAEEKLKIESENIQLKEQLIEQQKSELMGYSMEIAGMNERIEELIKNIEKRGEDPRIGKQLKTLVTVNKSWDSFITRFKEVDPEFIPKLSKKYTNLTQKDLEFCALVRINISYKDIANFLQISHESVFKKRYRIAQKMELEKGTDFQQFIIQFS